MNTTFSKNGILKKVRFRIGGQMRNSLPEHLRSAKSKEPIGGCQIVTVIAFLIRILSIFNTK